MIIGTCRQLPAGAAGAVQEWVSVTSGLYDEDGSGMLLGLSALNCAGIPPHESVDSGERWLCGRVQLD